MGKFVIITPAKNEEKHIEKTILSMVQQTYVPEQWVIVSDGSTDRTDDIIREYAEKYPFIVYIRNESPAGKNFSSKVHAFNKGKINVHIKNYDFIGNIDADVSFERTYFEQLLKRFAHDPNLGIAGGLVHESYKGRIKPMRVSRNSVAGAVQLFRCTCFEQIGGYIPVKMGGIDAAAEISARAKGWITQTFDDLKVIHHGPMLTGKGNPLQTKYQMGYRHYSLGYHPIFHIFRCVYRISESPYLLGGLAYFCGYMSALLKREEIKLPDEIVRYLHREQKKRICDLFKLF